MGGSRDDLQEALLVRYSFPSRGPSTPPPNNARRQVVDEVCSLHFSETPKTFQPEKRWRLIWLPLLNDTYAQGPRPSVFVGARAPSEVPASDPPRAALPPRNNNHNNSNNNNSNNSENNNSNNNNHDNKYAAVHRGVPGVF